MGKGKAKPTSGSAAPSPPTVHAERYLSLLKKSLLNQLYTENEVRLIFLLNYFGAQPVNFEALIPEYLGIRNHDLYKTVESCHKTGGFIPFYDANGAKAHIILETSVDRLPRYVTWRC